MKVNVSVNGIVLSLLLGSYSLFGADTPAAPNQADPKASDGTAAPATKPSPPATAADTPAPALARGARGNRVQVPATEADIAEIAKLNDLPQYAISLADGNYSTGPDYAPAPEQTAREGVPQGKIVSFTMDSAESKIFPGINGPFQRAVSVYIPSQYVLGTPAPFIVSCDAYGLARKQLPTILDNMIADHRLPPMVAIMIANGGTANRSYEYDTVSGKYAEFVETEVLPRVEKEARIKLTKDPEGRMTYGGSSGGVCAFTMAWFHPELYHRVLSYSGTFVNLKNGPDAPHGAWEYHENFISKTPAKPLRCWLHVSQNDNGATSASSGMRNWVIANLRMAEALKAKDYHYQLVYAKGAGHTDGKVITQTLPQALEYVWRGYPIEPAK
jgi:iron(III)-enterobactin esterase